MHFSGREDDRYKDNIYAIRRARFDIRRHRPHLQKLISRIYPNMHPDLIGLTVNYCTEPPFIDTFLIEDMKLEIDAQYPSEIANIDNIIQRAKAEDLNSSKKRNAVINVLYSGNLGKDVVRDTCIEMYEEGDEVEVPRLRTGIERLQNRPGCFFYDHGCKIPLDARYDEVDEVVRRMSVHTSKHPGMLQDPLSLVERVLLELVDDCPFEHRLQYLLGLKSMSKKVSQ